MEKNSKEIDDLSKNAFKAGLWYTISSIAVKAISIVTTPIYTRMMSASDYGIASTFISWYSLLLVFSSLNLTYSAPRAKQDFPGKFEDYLGSIQLMAAVLNILAAILMIIFIKPVALGLGIEPLLVYILIVYLFFSTAVTLAQCRYRYTYKIKENVAITIYITVSTALMSLIFLYFFKNKYLGKILGTALPTVLLGIFLWTITYKKRQLSINLEYWKYGLLLSVPLIIHTVSLNILSQSDRIFISKYCGNDATGFYSLAYQYAILINIVMNAISEAWAPWFYDKFALGEYSEIKKNIKTLIILGCFLGVCCIAFAPEAIAILGGKTYKSAIWVVPPVTIGIVCQYIYNHYVNIEIQLKKTKIISMGSLFAALTNIFLNILFIPKFGFIAAAYTTSFSYLILMLIHYFAVIYILKTKIYSNSFMFVSLFICGIIGIVFMLLYNTYILRYSILFMVLVIYFAMNREFIGKLIKNKRLF
ncbi:O-antigen/teichoic acid export membrane protein [Hydrogenispora ethanolica]|uniref:O-antigen/teichoic acid export membrane protein n=1 Tax=Hydrogenispora ethanolica TaxID=1082276 RepID=A0A4R1RXQ1_HYDET|nr:oligosaccharide flippase family protein [Hydrogenispora ethanolica]TCL70752.1 O-antigen/teichoic acid export membrane protein [Hydrogenispora ethanolica]